MALPLPPLRSARITMTGAPSAAARDSTSAVPSVDPSSTTRISRGTGSSMVERRSITALTVRASL
jgi:hypothetical protein